MSKLFTAEDVDAADEALRPHIQALVDRFGQAQTHEIVTKLALSMCPDLSGPPKFICMPREMTREREDYLAAVKAAAAWPQR
jgi:hypothetical protein